VRAQPVAARTVAEALAHLATDSGPAPGAAIPEIAGPREESFVDLARLLVSYCGEPLQIEGVGHPDEADRALYETGALLPGENAVLAGPTFEDWLTATP